TRAGFQALPLPLPKSLAHSRASAHARRPEFVRIGREGMPVTVSKVEDIGRQKIVREQFAGQPIAIVVPEDEDIPADHRVNFEPSGINIYADSWRAG
ncbi:ABC transporter ATP-binding protein, partial [Rhizobium ruizarguesonis]